MARPTSTPEHPPVFKFHLRLDGDYNQDVLVPQEAHVPMSTKDPALWTASTGAGNLIRRLPGGSWTQHKMLLGIMWAWENWEKEMGSPREIYEIDNSSRELPKFANLANEELKNCHPSDEEQVNLKNGALATADWSKGHYQWQHQKVAPSEIYHWELRPFPCGSPFDKELVFRAGSVTPLCQPVTIEKIETVHSWHEKWNELRNTDKQTKHGWMHVIGDYDVGYRYGHAWDQEMLRNENEAVGSFPARLLLLGSSLPFKGQHPHRLAGAEPKKEITRDDDHFWNSLLYQKDGKEHRWTQKAITDGLIGTVVVVGVDMLRLKGADIAFDQSWDRILEDFNREKLQCDVVQKLCRFEHLIVRVGVTGVIYHYRERVKGPDGKPLVDKDGRVQLSTVGVTQLIYDPNAPRIWFRAPDDQGNILGTRSALAACIAARLARGWGEHLTPQDLIIRGAKDAVCFMQDLYRKGLGNDSASLQFHTTPIYYRDLYAKTVLWAGKKDHKELKAATDERSIAALKRMGDFHLPQRNHYIAHVHSPVDESPMEWGIVRSALRMGIPDERGDLKRDWKRHIDFVAEQRRLWLAMKIVMDGHASILNSPERHHDYHEKLKELRKWQAKDANDITLLNDCNNWEIPSTLAQQVMAGKRSNNDTEAQYFLHYLALIYPFNAPIAQFGTLIALGQREVETYTNIRNLLTNHLRHGRDGSKALPLNIAVFGGPGSGKSFGVKRIAEELGIFHPLEFNVSQFRDKTHLDIAMLRVSDALARRKPGDKPPLVFFDEFDCSSPDGNTEFMWLSHFLEPMQDGTYQHPSGTLTLGDSIFVFAGGIHASYREFQDRAVGFGSEEDRHQAKVRKFPDFVSRIRGFVDVGSLNAKEMDEEYSPNDRDVPFLQRALTLRGMLEAAKCIDAKGHALIHEDVVEAFLTVSRFQHGKRSMESLIKSCVRIKQQIVQSSFPSQYQLDMHTWGGEFRERMHLPGSFWLTEFLFVPSQPEQDSDPVKWKPVDEWDLLDFCHGIPASENEIAQCARIVLERLFDSDSEVWLRRENVQEASSKLAEWLKCKFNGTAPKEPRGWYRPNDIYVLDSHFKKAKDGSRMWPEFPGNKRSSTWVGPTVLLDLVNRGQEMSEVVIPFVMLEEVRPINLRLHWKNGKMVLLSDSLRLAESVDREAGNSRPHPRHLWTKEWSWHKKDKARILWHLLKNFYITVHGEKRWKDYVAKETKRPKRTPQVEVSIPAGVSITAPH